MTRKKEGIPSITEIGYNHYRARSAGAPTASISPPDEDLKSLCAIYACHCHYYSGICHLMREVTAWTSIGVCHLMR